MTASPLMVALADRYRIERELGEGGMATVYLAHDLKHDRRVAVKVLHPDLGASLGADRFLAEVRTTARLQHPHILTLIDSGEAAGRLFYVMPFVQGESLRTRIQREGALSVADALTIASQVADALHHAHALGVVHRDVKPENVLLRDGHAFVADFGVALSVQHGATRLTQTGLALGTPLYMSPEQFLGDAVDGRTDLYALACMLFEMLTGALPFSGDSAQALLARRLTQDAPRVRSLRPDVPAMVELVLARALSREPEQRHETLAEFGAALQAEWSGATARTAGQSLSAPPHLPGRAREVSDALELVEGLGRGKGGVLLIAGEPGVGKTRLANTILTVARARGAMALVGRCYEMEGTPPFTPFAEVLDYVSRLVPPAEFRASLGDAAPEVARVQPLLRQQFPDIPAPVELPPERVRAYLHTRYREFMLRAAAASPQVVLFDDLHWADESSLALLEYLAGVIGEMPVLLVGTYRDTDLDVRRPFAATLERLTRQRLAKRVALRRLGAEGVAEQLAALGGSTPPPSLVSLLHRETDGNPFFVEEVFQHLREEGRLFDDRGEWRTDLTEDEIDVPEGVRLVVGRRLERLGEAVQSMLTTAAVIGPRFVLPVLVAAHEQPEDTVLDLLDAAAAAQLLVEQRGGREVVYAFSHELIRQTLLAGVSMPRRQRKHLKVADAFERVYGERVTQRAADVAHHLYQAGLAADADRTVRYLVQAARQAVSATACNEALSLAQMALAVEDVGDATILLQLFEVMARAQQGLARWQDAYGSYKRALSYAYGTNDRTAVARIGAQGFMVGSWLDHWTEILDMAAEAVRFTEGDVSEERLALLAVAGAANAIETSSARSHLLEEADALVAAIGQPRLARFVLHARCLTAVTVGDVSEVVRTAAAAKALFTEPSERAQFTEMAGRHQWFRAYRGEHGHREDTVQLLRMAEETGDVGLVASCDNYTLLTEYCTRAPLSSLVEFVDRTAARWQIGPWANLLWFYRAPAFAEQGKAEEAYRMTQQALAALPRTHWDGLLHGVALRAAHRAGPELAADADRLFMSFVPKQGDVLSIGARHMALALSWVWFAEGEFNRIAELGWVHRESQEVGMRVVGPHITAAHEALALACADDFERAEALFGDAADLCAVLDHRHGLIETLRWFAWMLGRRGAGGDHDKARMALGQAIELARDLEYGVTLAEMQEELARVR